MKLDTYTLLSVGPFGRDRHIPLKSFSQGLQFLRGLAASIAF